MGSEYRGGIVKIKIYFCSASTKMQTVLLITLHCLLAGVPIYDKQQWLVNTQCLHYYKDHIKVPEAIFAA